jgi:hypothetical protein
MKIRGAGALLILDWSSRMRWLQNSLAISLIIQDTDIVD